MNTLLNKEKLNKVHVVYYYKFQIHISFKSLQSIITNL